MKKLISGILLSSSLFYGAASATTIYYSATDIADTTTGEDLWQYNYSVTDNTFAAFDGFTIWFDYGLFENINPVTASFDWDPVTWQPENILGFGDDGAYDALALVDNPDLSVDFTVSFAWLGGPEGPGAQFFDVYDGNYDIIESGMTVAAPVTSSVPEPSTLMLLGIGSIMLLGLKRNKALVS
jgi:hypothetical protein